MQRTHLVAAILIILALAFSAACGGGSTIAVGGSPGTAPVSLVVRDTPPAGVTLLSFELTVTGAVLQPGNVSLVTTPIKIELERLAVETAFLSTVNVPAGPYDSITVTFANPELTILNNSGSSFGTCLNGQVCELKPPLAQASVTFSGSPFPLTITASTPVGLLLHFDVLNSISSNLASINPSITFSLLPAVQPTGQLEEIEEVVGKVTAKNAANNEFTLQHVLTGLSLTIKVDNNTQFEGFDKIGLANSFSSLAVGQIVEVDLRLLAGGMLLAKKVELEEDVNQEELEGVVVKINSLTQFEMVLLEEVPDIPGVEVGNLVRINLLSGTKFRVDPDNLPISGLSFSSASDLMVGQAVEVERKSGPSGTPPTIDTDAVTLKDSRFTATVKAKLNATDFTVDKLSELFTSAGINQIEVRTSAQTSFENVSGVVALNVGDTVSLRGLLFRTTGDPVLVAEKVRKR
jgi:hypothetical protein